MPEYQVNTVPYPLITYKENSTPISDSIEYMHKQYIPSFNGKITIRDNMLVQYYKYALHYPDNHGNKPLNFSSLNELKDYLLQQEELPCLIQFEKVTIKADSHLSQYILNCIIYPEKEQMHISPADIMGAGVVHPSDFEISTLMDQVSEHFKKLTTFPDTIITEELNTPIGTPSVEVDIPRLVYPYEQQELLREIFPVTGSPQGLYTIQFRKVNACSVPGALTSFIVRNNNLTITECTYLLTNIPKHLTVTPNQGLTKGATSMDGHHQIIPGNDPLHIYLLADYLEGTSFTYDEQDLQKFKDKDFKYYIIEQSNGKFIITNTPLDSLECIQQNNEWVYGFTSTNQIIFIRLTACDHGFFEIHKQALGWLRQKQAEKSSLVDCLLGHTGGKHDNFLGILDDNFHEVIGRITAKAYGLAGSILIPHITQTEIRILAQTLIHEATFISSQYAQYITYTNGSFFTPSQEAEKNTIKDRIKNSIPNYHKPSKSRRALFFSLFLICIGLSTFFFLEKIIWAGVLTATILLSLIILYQYNWVNYILCTIRQKPQNTYNSNLNSRTAPTPPPRDYNPGPEFSGSPPSCLSSDC